MPNLAISLHATIDCVKNSCHDKNLRRRQIIAACKRFLRCRSGADHVQHAADLHVNDSPDDASARELLAGVKSKVNLIH
jgi:adenine C2-methylase RlmN of 23S rRNA A2503 and tRNA A37